VKGKSCTRKGLESGVPAYVGNGSLVRECRHLHIKGSKKESQKDGRRCYILSQHIYVGPNFSPDAEPGGQVRTSCESACLGLMCDKAEEARPPRLGCHGDRIHGHIWKLDRKRSKSTGTETQSSSLRHEFRHEEQCAPHCPFQEDSWWKHNEGF
jgi:hypothetical protein